jgi:putative transposase
MTRSHTAHATTPTAGYATLRHGRVSEPGRIYLVTTVTRERSRIFANPDAARSAAACLGDARIVGDNRLLAWVLMPDHLHVLLELGKEVALSVCVARIKSASARAVNARLGIRGALWEPGFHDHAMRCEESIADAARYVICNPLRAGLVDRVEDYEFWYQAWS